jgi:hypothetical protein
VATSPVYLIAEAERRRDRVTTAVKKPGTT